MNRQTAVQAKETGPLRKNRASWLSHAAVRPVAETETLPGSAAGGLAVDLTSVPVRPQAQAAGQTATRSCPMSPQRCPFGGACHSCPPRVQAKLKIGQPGDKYEQEADRVAEQVMRMPEPQVQRKGCSSCKGKEEDEDKILQAKSVSSAGNAPAQVDHPLIQNVLSSPGQPLDAGTRSFMEPRFGQDFSGVRVHVGGEAAESARAYTVGRDVVFGEGQYAPGNDEGRRLVAHELVHVGQQGIGEKISTIFSIHSLGKHSLGQGATQSASAQISANQSVVVNKSCSSGFFRNGKDPFPPIYHPSREVDLNILRYLHNELRSDIIKASNALRDHPKQFGDNTYGIAALIDGRNQLMSNGVVRGVYEGGLHSEQINMNSLEPMIQNLIHRDGARIISLVEIDACPEICQPMYSKVSSEFPWLTIDVYSLYNPASGLDNKAQVRNAVLAKGGSTDQVFKATREGRMIDPRTYPLAKKILSGAIIAGSLSAGEAASATEHEPSPTPAAFEAGSGTNSTPKMEPRKGSTLKQGTSPRRESPKGSSPLPEGLPAERVEPKVEVSVKEPSVPRERTRSMEPPSRNAIDRKGSPTPSPYRTQEGMGSSGVGVDQGSMVNAIAWGIASNASKIEKEKFQADLQQKMPNIIKLQNDAPEFGVLIVASWEMAVNARAQGDFVGVVPDFPLFKRINTVSGKTQQEARISVPNMLMEETGIYHGYKWLPPLSYPKEKPDDLSPEEINRRLLSLDRSIDYLQGSLNKLLVDSGRESAFKEASCAPLRQFEDILNYPRSHTRSAEISLRDGRFNDASESARKGEIFIINIRELLFSYEIRDYDSYDIYERRIQDLLAQQPKG